MTLRKATVLFVFVAIFALRAIAQTPAAPTKSAESSLAPIAWLVGGTWVSDVRDSKDGSVTHVENHITWASNHQAIQFVTDFNGKPHYNGFYAYNPVTKTIGFYYTNSGGELTIGTTTPNTDGKTLHQEFEIMKPDGTTGHVRSTLVRDGDDAYWFTVFMQHNGEWAQVFKIRYERK